MASEAERDKRVDAAREWRLKNAPNVCGPDVQFVDEILASYRALGEAEAYRRAATDAQEMFAIHCRDGCECCGLEDLAESLERLAREAEDSNG